MFHDTPDREAYATMADLPQPLPDGYATVLVAISPEDRYQLYARVDSQGFIRRVGSGGPDNCGNYVPTGWTVKIQKTGETTEV